MYASSRRLQALVSFLVCISASAAFNFSCNDPNSTYYTFSRKAANISLEFWAGGITRELMQETVERFACSRERGFHVGFLEGKAYVLSPVTDLPGYFHHPLLMLTYLRLLHWLQRHAPKPLPNVEFVISTFDNVHQPITITPPPHDWSRPPHNHTFFPVFRISKSIAYPDILIPEFHFHMKSFETQFLGHVDAWRNAHPWSTKKPVAFGRFHPYQRITLAADAATQRKGARTGTHNLTCTQHDAPFGRMSACDVRQHLIDWAQSLNRSDVDIGSTTAGVPVGQWPAYKYLVHVDGQSISSRMVQTLAMGSLVIKEESGYLGFYSPFLQPYRHYVPFWRTHPEELLDALAWAAANDTRAQQVAERGVAFARRYLSVAARSCYWVKLLQSFARLLKYVPRINDFPHAVPVHDFIHKHLLVAKPDLVLADHPWEP